VLPWRFVEVCGRFGGEGESVLSCLLPCPQFLLFFAPKLEASVPSETLVNFLSDHGVLFTALVIIFFSELMFLRMLQRMFWCERVVLHSAPSRWAQYILLKRQYLYITLHDVTSQKTVIFTVTAVGTLSYSFLFHVPIIGFVCCCCCVDLWVIDRRKIWCLCRKNH
jgi:hypothetical protein